LDPIYDMARNSKTPPFQSSWFVTDRGDGKMRGKANIPMAIIQSLEENKSWNVEFDGNKLIWTTTENDDNKNSLRLMEEIEA
tara:strand:- start:726 stop:971 length:246 start_codon:yes stop_codon:yes gene_type:complete